MALVLEDRVKVRSRTTGTGTFALENTVAGFQSFEAIGDGNETFYSIVDAAGNWEVGRGTYTLLDNTLSRDSVLSSSNSNTLVDFPAGSKNVFCTYPASVATSVTTGGGLATDSFKTIAVSGQTSVVADSSTDTLTLVAGTGITLTTEPTTDSITISNSSAELVNGSNTVSLYANGKLGLSGAIVAPSGVVSCDPNVDTVIYSTSSSVSTLKLVIQAEGDDGSDSNWHTQSCDMIVVSRYNGSTRVVDDSVYGVVYTSGSPIVVLASQYNSSTFEIEITARPVSVTNNVYVKTHVIEIITAAP